MAFLERAIEINVQPPILFVEGQRLGFAGAPIPLEIANGHAAYLDLLKNFGELSAEDRIAFHRASARASSRSESERGSATTEMERALDATVTIEGYSSSDGLVAYLMSSGADNAPRLTLEEMITLSPAIISGSVDGMRAYMAGYDFQTPTHLEDGQVYKGNVSLEDAHTLGVIVRAATLGERVNRSEVPASKDEWTAFQYGMTVIADKRDRGFYELLIKVEADSAMSERLIKMNVLGIEIQAAIQRTAAE